MEVQFSNLNTWEFIRTGWGLLWLFSLSPLRGRGNRECRRQCSRGLGRHWPKIRLSHSKLSPATCFAGKKYLAFGGSFCCRCWWEGNKAPLVPASRSFLFSLFPVYFFPYMHVSVRRGNVYSEIPHGRKCHSRKMCF